LHGLSKDNFYLFILRLVKKSYIQDLLVTLSRLLRLLTAYDLDLRRIYLILVFEGLRIANSFETVATVNFPLKVHDSKLTNVVDFLTTHFCLLTVNADFTDHDILSCVAGYNPTQLMVD
jgi:hypothetical protein